MQPDLLALAARVEELTGPDREVDAEVFRALGCPLPDGFAGVKVDLTWQDDGTATMAIGDMQVRYTPPTYTASVDAVLVLIGRELPGWAWGVSMGHAAFLTVGEPPFTADIMGNVREVQFGWGEPPELAYDNHAGKAAAPALALLSAALKAKAAQQQMEADRG